MKIERKNRNIWYLSVIVLVLVSSTSISAQAIRFSLYASPSVGFAETDFQVDKSPQMRFGAGFEASYFFRPHYELSSGIRISHLGSTLNYQDHEIKIGAKYLEIPFNIKLSTDEIGYFTYYGKFGLIAGFKSSERINISPSPSRDENERYLADVMGSFELGGGLEYNLGGQMSVFAELSFHNNFTSAINKDLEPFSGHEKLYLNAVALTFGAIF